VTAMSFSKDDERIRVFDSQGKGVSAARNYGLELSTGDHIAFIDSDDSVDPDYLSVLVELAEKNNADISQCSLYYRYDNGTVVQEKETEDAVYNGHDEIMNAYFSGMVGKICLAAWGKLFRRELLNGIRFDETLTIQEDAFFTFQCAMKSSKIACCNRALYYYYQNSASVMNRAFDGSKMQYFTVLDRELDICKGDLALASEIMRRKVVTALDLTTQIIRDDAGHEYLDEMKKIAIETSVKIKEKFGFKTRVKLFVLRHFSALYYGLLKIKYK
jgi:glycosyltransferase involved in cell wall biosynthesis